MIDSEGPTVAFTEDVYLKYDLILPSPIFPHRTLDRHGEKWFSWITLHGVNEVILKSSLRLITDGQQANRVVPFGLNKADAFELDLKALDGIYSRIECDAQEAQKSHGLCPPNPGRANPLREFISYPKGLRVRFRSAGWNPASMKVSRGNRRAELMRGTSW